MSELREWTASEIEEYDDARLELAEDGKIDCTRVYIKADADEVISTIRAERDEYRYNLSCARNEIHNLLTPMKEDVKTIAKLKDEVLQYKVLYKEHCRDLWTQERLFAKQIVHQKFKRCLAMARWCKSEEKRLEAIAPIFDTDKECWEYNSDYWYKQRERWLGLAVKFKDKE